MCILVFAKKPTKQTKKPQASNKKIKIKNQPTSNIKVRKVLAAFEKNPPQIEKHLINLLRGTQAKQLETGDSRIAVHNPRSYFHTFLKNSWPNLYKGNLFLPQLYGQGHFQSHAICCCAFCLLSGAELAPCSKFLPSVGITAIKCCL